MSSETKVANEPGVGGAHDAGGAKQVISDTVLQPELGDVPYEWWEKKTHALGGFLESIPNVKNPIMSAHELRRAIESLHHSTYVWFFFVVCCLLFVVCWMVFFFFESLLVFWGG